MSLDSRLARLLPGHDRTGGQEVDGAVAERVLDILEVIATGPRIVPLIAQLMQCANARLRARAALIIGRRLQNARSAETLLQETDPHVRASAVEALWGGDSPAIRTVLSHALKDRDERVIGNAMVGLYRLQDQNIIPHVLNMCCDEKPEFRATAAWAIGQTADPRFLAALARLSSDLYARVRTNAGTALARCRPRRKQQPRVGCSGSKYSARRNSLTILEVCGSG